MEKSDYGCSIRYLYLRKSLQEADCLLFRLGKMFIGLVLIFPFHDLHLQTLLCWKVLLTVSCEPNTSVVGAIISFHCRSVPHRLFYQSFQHIGFSTLFYLSVFLFELHCNESSEHLSQRAEFVHFVVSSYISLLTCTTALSFLRTAFTARLESDASSHSEDFARNGNRSVVEKVCPAKTLLPDLWEHRALLAGSRAL